MADVDNDEALLEFLADEEDEYNLVNADEDALLADDNDLFYKKSSQKEQEILEDTGKPDEVDDVLHISDYGEELDEEHDGVTTISTIENSQIIDEEREDEETERESAKFRLERQNIPISRSDTIPDTLDQIITHQQPRVYKKQRGHFNRRPMNRMFRNPGELKTVHINPHFRGQVHIRNETRLAWDARQRLNNQRGISEFDKIPHVSPLRRDDNGMLPPMNRPPQQQWFHGNIPSMPPVQQQHYGPPNQIFPPQQQQQPPPPQQWNQFPIQNQQFNQVPGNPPSQFGQQNQFMGPQFNPHPYYAPNTTPYQAPVQNNFVRPPPVQNNFVHPPPYNPGSNPPHPNNFSQPRNEIRIFGAQHHCYQQIPNNVNSVHSRVGMKIENIRRRTDLPFVQRKKRVFATNSNLQEVRTVELPELPVINKVQEVKPVEEVKIEDEDEETKAYRLQIQKQKELREKILREKEARRLQAAKQDSSLAVNTLQSILNTNPLVSPPKEPQISKDFLNSRTVLAKDEALEDTHVVIVSNLAVGTTEIKLRKMSQGIGTIQKFEMSPEERQATITFESVASAHAFFKKYQRTMLDLSMIKVALKSPE